MQGILDGRQFRVVTHRNWVCDFFSEFDPMHDFGFDINPATAPDTLWWTTGHWVAQARAAGVSLPLTSCGPRWLENLPCEYSRRDVQVCTVAQLNDLDWTHGSAHVKLPEVKVDSFPAQVVDSVEDIAMVVANAAIPWNSPVQISAVTDFVSEARFFVAHGWVTTGSMYRHGDTWWGEAEDIGDNSLLSTLRSFADEVAACVSGAPGYSLDVGLTARGELAVIEANAAWSSGVYDCDPEGVLKAIVASHDFEGEYSSWAWSGDPLFDHVRPLHTINR